MCAHVYAISAARSCHLDCFRDATEATPTHHNTIRPNTLERDGCNVQGQLAHFTQWDKFLLCTNDCPTLCLMSLHQTQDDFGVQHNTKLLIGVKMDQNPMMYPKETGDKRFPQLMWYDSDVHVATTVASYIHLRPSHPPLPNTPSPQATPAVERQSSDRGCPLWCMWAPHPSPPNEVCQKQTPAPEVWKNTWRSGILDSTKSVANPGGAYDS